jgi:transposase
MVETYTSCSCPAVSNLKLHHVLSEITGVSGLKILDAILVGERDPITLASLCNWRIRSPREVVAKSMEGDYREKHLFALRQSLVGYRFYTSLIAEVDVELEAKTRELPRALGGPEEMPPRTDQWVYQRAGNEPEFDLRREMFRIAGVDLTDVHGISALTAYTILTEAGPDVSRFRNASAFASWLGLCPEKQVSGGKVLYSRSRKVKNRAAIALRLGAHCLYRAKHYLGEFHRRMKWRLGGPEAVTATAHKLARIVYHIISTKEPYSEDVLVRRDHLASQRAEIRLRKQAANLGYRLTPIPETSM